MTTYPIGSRAILHTAPKSLSCWQGQECAIISCENAGQFCGVKFADGHFVVVPAGFLRPVPAAKKARRSTLKLAMETDTRPEVVMDKQLSLPAIPAALRPRKSKQCGYKRRQPEFEEQCRFFAFLRQYAKQEPRFGYIFAVPNGLALQPKVAAAAVAQGVLSGVWDVAVPYCGFMDEEHERWVWMLWIEFKAGKNTLTESQERFRNALPSVYGFVVVYSWIDAARIVCEYLEVENETILRAIQ